MFLKERYVSVFLIIDVTVVRVTGLYLAISVSHQACA